MDPSTLSNLPGGTYIVTGLAVLSGLSIVARGMAQIGFAINGKADGAGSGWFRFWNRIATFPGLPAPK